MAVAKMESWLLYSLIAMFSFGIYNFLLKVSVDSRFGGPNPTTSVLSISLAIFLSTLAYGIYTNAVQIPSKPGILVILLLVGVMWTIGTVASALAFQKGNASQVMPILNANTLLVVVLSLVFLGEATSLQYVIKIVAGTVLILAGIFVLA